MLAAPRSASSSWSQRSRGAFAAVVAAVALGALVFTARPAAAGSCGGDEDVLETVKDVERFAKRGGKEPVIEEFCAEEAMNDPALKKRLFTACERILAREPGYQTCLLWAADAGRKTLGGVDIYPALAVFTSVDPFGPHMNGAYNVGLYKRLGDPRAVQPVREMWQATLGNPRTTKRHDAHLWTVFRNNAISLFEKLGGAAERDFLVEQAAATKDRPMKKRMQKAIKAMDRRLAKP